MQNNSLLFGIVGFILGGLLVSIAATTFEKSASNTTESHGANSSMSSTTESLKAKKGDDFDKAFMAEMIIHHESAVEMAELSQSRANHSEVKDLSKEIITAQQLEIAQMKQWQKDWGYAASHGTSSPSGSMSH